MKRKHLIYFMLLLIIFTSCGRYSENNIAGEQVVVEKVNTLTMIHLGTKEEQEETSTVSEFNSYTNTPEITPDTNYIEEIDNISEKIMVYQELDIESEKLSLEFSLLDFSLFTYGENKDIREPFYSYPIPVYNFFDIWNIQFYNNDSRFIYLVDDYSVSGSYLYQYDIESTKTERISNNANIYFARVTPNEKQILYKLRDDRIYVVDFSGIGQEYASNLFILSIPILSPNGKYIAFVGEPRKIPNECSQDDDYITDLNLYFMSSNEPNNPIQLSTERVKEGNCGKRVYGNWSAWSPDSTEFIYVRELEKDKEIICKVNVADNTETCFPDHYFTLIDTFHTSSKNLLIVSGMIEAVNHTNCVVCTLEEMNTNLYLLDMNNGELIQISDYRYSEINPMWIENDQYIVYESYQPDTWQVFITDKSGSFHEQLTFSDYDTYIYQREY
jgi:Tol biopolymer transport system component